MLVLNPIVIVLIQNFSVSPPTSLAKYNQPILIERQIASAEKAQIIKLTKPFGNTNPHKDKTEGCPGYEPKPTKE
jgi:hypothetical protein